MSTRERAMRIILGLPDEKVEEIVSKYSEFVNEQYLAENPAAADSEELPFALKRLTKEEFEEAIARGIKQAEAGQGIPAEEAFGRIFNDINGAL